MRIICSLIFFFPSIFFAQTDSVFSNKGDLLSVNEIGINKLILKYEKILKKRNGINGWRVQLKFKAKEAEIVKLKSKFIKNYPDIPIYLMYDEPYYKIRVGNCRNRLDAIRIKNKISKHFPGSYPVPELINFSDFTN